VAAIQQNSKQIARNGQPVEPLLSERDVASICGLSAAAIRRWRLLGKGPRYIKISSIPRSGIASKM